MSDPSYIQFQIAASEALREGSNLYITKEERMLHFMDAQKFATKAFLAAKDNVFLRYLSMCQATCAGGLMMIAENDYNSQVVIVKDGMYDSIMGDVQKWFANPENQKILDRQKKNSQ